MRSTPLFALLLPLVLLAMPRSSQAQELDRIESLLLRGRITDARAALAQWHEQSSNAPSEQQAHAMMLRGQLATNVADATDAYLALALTYPTSHYAPLALLRLSQGLLASGEPERARGYLERLVRDYPNAADRAEAMLWLARAERATGREAASCRTLQAAATLQTRAETEALIDADEERACAS